MSWISNLKQKKETKKEEKSKTIDIRDAMDLENYDRIKKKNAVMRKVIDNTYGPKSPTKKRRKLPGKRKWKDKKKIYAPIVNKMTVEEFNAKTKAKKAVERVYKQKQLEEARVANKHNRHMLYGDE